jgi:hypothetical protein
MPRPRPAKEDNAPRRDPRVVVVVRPGPAGMEAMAARMLPVGIEVIATERFAANDHRLADWATGLSAARMVGVLVSTACVVRAVQMPSAPDERLHGALELNANSFVLGRTPSWRVAWSLLPGDRGGMRTGIVAEWPEDGDDPVLAPSEALPVAHAPEVAALAALATLAHDPLVHVDAERGSVAVCIPSSKGILARTFRVGLEGEPIEATEVVRAVAEACVHASLPNDEMSAAMEAAERAASPVLGGGFGCTDADAARFAEAVRAVGTSDPQWWRRHGIEAGTALACFGPVATLTQLQDTDPGAQADRLATILNRLAQPRTARAVIVAALATIVLAPVAFEGARLLLMRWKLPDPVAYESAEGEDRKRQALYRVLSRQGASMTKTLSDLASCAPEGLEVDFINVAPAAGGQSVSVRGKARPAGTQQGEDVLIAFERNLRETGAFTAISRSSDAPDARGYQAFNVSATATRPTVMVALPEDIDYAKRSMRERRYGPPPADVDEAASGLAPRAGGSATEAAVAPEPSSLASASDRTEPARGEASPAPGPSMSGRRSPTTVAAGAPNATGGTDAGASSMPGGTGTGTTSMSGGSSGGSSASDATESATRPSGTRSVRGSSGTGTARSGLATRGNPGATNEPEPLPPPLTSNEIDLMSKQEAQNALAIVSTARRRADLSDEDAARLRREFDMLLERCKRP